MRLDGAALEHYDPDVLGSYIGYLPQDVVLFDGTVAENISRMQSEPDAAQIVEAAKKAGAHEMILELPQGYDTPVSAGGARLSGGQKQRIGLARAFYGDPVFLVLDEPNSNLDAAGQDALNLAIRQAKDAGKAVIIMAHRPAGIAECELILIMDNGTAKAFGPRDEVLKAHVRNYAQVAGRIGSEAQGMTDTGRRNWNIRPFLLLGYGALFFLVFGIGAWGRSTSISGAVIAPGALEVEGNRQVVQHLSGGVIDAIDARDGESVEEGRGPRSVSKASQIRAELGIVEGQFFEILARKSRLSAERDGLEEIVFYPELIERAAVSPDLQELMAAQQQQFESRPSSCARRIQPSSRSSRSRSPTRSTGWTRCNRRTVCRSTCSVARSRIRNNF